MSKGKPKPEDVYLSVVIRNRNQAKNLRKLFEALMAQRCSFAWEIIVVDNESEDESLELCKQYDARVVYIGSHEWTPGRADNRGISAARGQLVLLCSTHSMPVGSRFLESSVAPFVDPQMAAVRCMHGGNKEETTAWYRHEDIHYESLEEQKIAESGTAWLARYPSAACCVIRRSVWEQVPYDERLEGLEDKLWASAVLSKGFKTRCSGEAVFAYNPTRTTRDVWKRENRMLIDLYRSRGYVALSWSHFFIKVVRTAALAPLVGIKYFVQEVISSIYLVIIPWQAKFAPRAGSISEYNKPRTEPRRQTAKIR
jgi:glycosyltransferase involved in cell wall biosynthesis